MDGPATEEEKPARPPKDCSSWCTHVTYSRLYLQHGDGYECARCKRRPSNGWLYRCTQDFDGHLPASDFNQLATTRRLEHDAQLYTLNPSVMDAAAKGQYTQKELATLWKQKETVRKLVQSVVRPTTSSSESTVSTSTYSVAASTSYSTFPSTESEADLDYDASHRGDCFPVHRGFLETIPEVHDDLEGDMPVLPFARGTVPKVCHYKICASCVAFGHREKAYGSLNAVMQTPYRQLAPSPQEFANKRLSNTDVVRNFPAGPNLVDHGIDVQEFPLTSPKRHSQGEFREILQRLLRGQQADHVTYPPSGVTADGQPLGLSRVVRYPNLAAIDSSSFSRVGSLSSASISESASFDNGNTTFSSTRTSGLPDDDKSSTTSFGPRPIFLRRGFERMTSIKLPSRVAVSHSGESASSRAPSTTQSTSSCPGFVERESMEKEKRSKSDNNEASEVKPDESGSACEAVVVGASSPSRQPRTPTESTHGSILGFKWTPKANPRFFID